MSFQSNLKEKQELIKFKTILDEDIKKIHVKKIYQYDKLTKKYFKLINKQGLNLKTVVASIVNFKF